MTDTQNPFRRRWRLAVFDLDGTLLRDDKTISGRTSAAVRAVIASGRAVAIATGRHPNSALRFFEQMDALSKGSLAVCFNGSAVVDIEAFKSAGAPDSMFKTLWEDTASAGEMMEVDAASRAAGLDLHAYTKADSLVVEKVTRYSMREIFHSKVSYSDGWDFSSHPDERYYKAVATGEPEAVDAFRASLPQKVRDAFAVMRTDENFLEFIPHGNSKGTALLRLCAALGADPSEAVSFGDAENDLQMIGNAGLGVAMGNATAELKAEADFVAATNMEDGVAAVLERLLKEGC
jgi:Cof subfamily protein (haloacid dehalogenase superfamily)